VYLGTIGTVSAYYHDSGNQPYMVDLDKDGECVSFEEDELEFA
jgi:hypothetical protein